MELNKLPHESEIIVMSSKKNITIKLDCFLHPKDIDSLIDNISNFLKNNCQKSIDFSNDFNNEIKKFVK